MKMIKLNQKQPFPKGTMSRLSLVGDSLRIPNSRLHILKYVQLAEKLKRTRGSTQATKDLKQLYNWVKASALGLSTPNTDIWLSTRRDNIPKPIRKVLDNTPIKGGQRTKSVPGYQVLDLSDRNVARFVLSLFSLYETWKPIDCGADIETLTRESEVTISLQMSRELKTFFKHYAPVFRRHFVKRGLKEPKDYISLKGGVNGTCTIYSHLDAISLLSSKEYLGKYVQYTTKASSRSPRDLVNELESIPNVSTKPSLPYVFKTIGIPDKGPKVRTITMGNYFIQRSLRPFHDSLMHTLRNIPEDGTYRQDKAAQSVKDWTANGNQPFCFDLTSATDRFPVIIQYLVIKELYPEIATQWYRLIRKSESFDPKRSMKFRFAVGQPMGIYTSWAAFTLSHHFIIRYAYSKVGSDFRNNYYIIGDDVAILCPKAASEYERIILALGISISRAKSITPSNIEVSTNTVAELAKRYFCNGIEITPVRPYELNSLSGKGWPLALEVIPNLIHRWGAEDCSLMRTLLRYPPAESGNFLTWVDKTHRKKLLLVADRRLPRPPFEGVRTIWPEENSAKLIKADCDMILHKTATELEKIVKIGKSVDSWLSNGTQLQLSKDQIKLHPMHRALELDKEILLKFRARFDKGDPDSINLVYEIGVNLDLLLSMLESNKTVKDYLSMKSKRTQASAQAQLDTWAWLIKKYGFKPTFPNLPVVRSANLPKKSMEVCYAMHRYALLFYLKKRRG